MIFNVYLGAFAKLGKATISYVISVCLSVRPYKTTRLALVGFSWNLTFQYFSKLCGEDSSFIKILYELGVICMKTNTHF